MGRPNSGPGFAPARRSTSRARAAASTCAGSKLMNALSACADWQRARSACAYRSDVSAPVDIWATASTALRLQRPSAPSAAVPVGLLAPAADIAAVAVVPSTKVRREISAGLDTITPGVARLPSEAIDRQLHRDSSLHCF